MTSDAGCASPLTANSAKVYVIISPTVVPNVELIASSTSVCTGDTVNFTTIVAGQGTTPNYRFFVNGSSVQNGSAATWSSNALANGAVVKVVLTSSLSCASPTSVNDSTIIYVHPVGSSSQSGSLCSGSSYPFYGRTLTQAGTYYDTISTVYGCDSIITLHLTVSSNVSTQIVDQSAQAILTQL